MQFIKLMQSRQPLKKELVEYGKEVMANIPENCRPVVLLGRPYNSTDPHLNLALVDKLITQNVMPIPVDMLDLSPYQYFHRTTGICTGQMVRR